MSSDDCGKWLQYIDNAIQIRKDVQLPWTTRIAADYTRSSLQKYYYNKCVK